MGAIIERIQEKNKSRVSQKENVYQYYGQIPELTEQQKCVIRTNWQILKLDVANIGVITFVSMFENRPDLKNVFSSFRGKNLTDLHNSGLIRVHALRVMATVDKCVSRIDESLNFKLILRDLGHYHQDYQVKTEHIQSMLPAFLHAIKPHLQAEWSEEVEKAWSTFFSLILYYMGEGINTTIKPVCLSRDYGK